MLKDEKEWERFRDLTGIMENTPPKNPPESFTEKIMARLPEQEFAGPQFFLKRLFGNSAFSTNLNIGFRSPVTKKECSFYFFLTGFFYLILGLILLSGLYLGGLRYPEWLTVQPLIGILLAAELIALGIFVYTRGEAAIRLARVGMILYAGLVILNGLVGTLYIRIPVAIYFAAIFSITGLGITVLLRLAVDNYYPGNIFSEVR